MSAFLPNDVLVAVDPAGDDDATVVIDMKYGKITNIHAPTLSDAEMDDAIKRAAARIQEDIYAPIFGGVTTTSNIPDDPLDLTEMMNILDQARTARLEQDKKLVGALLDCGFQIVCNEFAYRPHALLPIEFQDALTAVLEERKRRVL